MTPIADMVQEMLARGVAADVIVLAVRAAEQASTQFVRGQSADKADAASERRRESDRIRKREERERLRISADNPQKSADANSALYLEDKKEDKEEKKERAKRSQGHKLSADWKPNAGHLAAGRQLGFTDPQIFDQAEDMRLWARTNEHRAVARKTDWDMTFLGWLRRNKPANGGNHGNRNRSSGRADQSALDAAMARGFGFGDGSVAGPAEPDIPRGRVELDLEPASGGRPARDDAA